MVCRILSRVCPLFISVVMMALISACGGTAPTAIPNNGQSTPITGALPSIQRSATRTPVPAFNPTLPSTFQTGVTFAQAAPEQIGRFKLDKAKSYVDRGGHGAVLIYNVQGKGDLQVSLFLIYNETEPAMSQNDAVDRYNVETGMIKTEKFPVALGDQAMVSPSNKAQALRAGENMTVWGELLYRNTVLILYPSPELVQNLTDFSKDEAVDLLTKLFAALPK